MTRENPCLTPGLTWESNQYFVVLFVKLSEDSMRSPLFTVVAKARFYRTWASFSKIRLCEPVGRNWISPQTRQFEISEFEVLRLPPLWSTHHFQFPFPFPFLLSRILSLPLPFPLPRPLVCSEKKNAFFAFIPYIFSRVWAHRAQDGSYRH